MQMENLKEIVETVAVVFMSITLLATGIVRLTPSKTDDEYVGKFASILYKVLAWLPTIGVNPQTKKLQEAYEELKQKKSK